MIKLGMNDTKWELFMASIDLFSKHGYGNVSVREIAEQVGIKPPAIYYHFKSKDEILCQIHDFYIANFYTSIPKLDDLVALIGKVPPREIFNRLTFFYDDKLAELMYKISKIAIKEQEREPHAYELMQKAYFDIPKEYLHTILTKMIEQNIIEPFDIDTWITIFSYCDFTSMFRGFEGYEKDSFATTEWIKCRNFLYSMIHIIEK